MDELPSSRLDVALRERYPNLSRSLIQKLIKNGYVTVDGVIQTKTGLPVGSSQMLGIDMSILEKPSVNLDLDILYEDENCVVINKPEGILTHSKGVYNPEPTVASWLKTRHHYNFDADDERGGIVHRLDRATSGVLICAKNKQAQGLLQKQFQNRTVKKTYLAKVLGKIQPEHAILDLPIERNPKKPQTFRVGANGKPSQTEYQIVSGSEHFSTVKLMPKSGRTHQLRVHMQYIHHPIIGDTLYGGPAADRLFLHAVGLEITVPGGIRKSFTIDAPKNFFKEK